jgi:hypothetical protein
MLKKLTLIMAALILLAFIIDPNLDYLKKSAARISNSIFGTNDNDDTELNDATDSLNSIMPDQPGFDSTEILQGIDSIESASKEQEIIAK